MDTYVLRGHVGYTFNVVSNNNNNINSSKLTFTSILILLDYHYLLVGLNDFKVIAGSTTSIRVYYTALFTSQQLIVGHNVDSALAGARSRALIGLS